ncbi:MAG: hypothetical protein JWR14_4783 [Caballeronia sp.]|jgi:hypothetical protein|nr:hypothetical protein [Caballeronia sp.]
MWTRPLLAFNRVVIPLRKRSATHPFETRQPHTQ